MMSKILRFMAYVLAILATFLMDVSVERASATLLLAIFCQKEAEVQR